jgi:hypothetical protein
MPKRFSKIDKADATDPNVTAFRVVAEATQETSAEPGRVLPMRRRKNPAAVALGRKGGLKSAAARMEKIPKATRINIAQNAARQRWRKEKGDG